LRIKGNSNWDNPIGAIPVTPTSFAEMVQRLKLSEKEYRSSIPLREPEKLSTATPSRIIGFYNGTESDHRGRYLNEIQKWPDDQLEAVHDYIQWLFPLPESSGFNVAVPVLTERVHSRISISS
jgi:hypothetical protein